MIHTLLNYCDRFTEWILHGVRPEHWNRNYGEVFAIWDWMLGPLVLPSEEIRKNLILRVDIGAPEHHPTPAKSSLSRALSEHVRNT